jgi:RimJ/RimL family protein N-acetyltransferase
MSQAPLAPVTLAGRYVRLEPLASEHIDALAEVGLDPDLWRWTTSQVTNRDEMAAYVQAALAGQAAGSALPFVTVEQASGRIIGSTRYGNIDLANRRVEIGWTWVARPWQRTAVNTEAKYLMLRHAFETLGCLRVELKTDVLNERSRRAIGRIGGREEGILRKHVITQSGRVRDTVYFSIIDDEWPAAKAALEARLG